METGPLRRWISRGAVLALSALGLAFATGIAAAVETPRTGWIDGASASSDCIGGADTPLCAVETALACRLRKDAALCDAAGLNPDEVLVSAPTARPPKPNRHPADVIEAIAVEYRIDAVNAQDDTARVAIGARYHGEDGLVWPERGWRLLTYSLGRDGGSGTAWRIDRINWTPLLRWIGPMDAASRCIGDAKTPLCAVETHIACRVRSDDDICAAAGKVEAKVFRPHRATVLYFTDRIRRWQPPEPEVRGTVSVVVWMAESTEFPAPDAKPEPGAAYVTRPTFVLTSYIVERQGTAWRVVSRAERP